MERLWAPWRLQYVADTKPKEPGCFLCNAWKAEGKERDHLVLGRGEKVFIIMNRYPYNNGHLMIVPVSHVGEMEAVSTEEAAEIWKLTVVCKEILGAHMNPQGFNVGINQGRCAGAGLLDHIHIHIVPRWNGDTNFMPVFSDTRVVPQALEELFDQLRPSFAERGL